MNLLASALLVFSLIASVVSDTYPCFFHGKRAKGTYVFDKLPQACDLLSAFGTYTHESNSSTVCVTDKKHIRWDLTLTYHGKDPEANISSGKCEHGMHWFADLCTGGSVRREPNWVYTADPNEGKCETEGQPARAVPGNRKEVAGISPYWNHPTKEDKKDDWDWSADGDQPRDDDWKWNADE